MKMILRNKGDGRYSLYAVTDLEKVFLGFLGLPF
jgi:hypothetical protein